MKLNLAGTHINACTGNTTAAAHLLRQRFSLMLGQRSFELRQGGRRQQEGVGAAAPQPQRALPAGRQRPQRLSSRKASASADMSWHQIADLMAGLSSSPSGMRTNGRAW